jgi:hypothetical protein
VAVAGGLTFSLVLTLYLVPAMHSLIAKKKLAVEEDEEQPRPLTPRDPAPTAGE